MWTTFIIFAILYCFQRICACDSQLNYCGCFIVSSWQISETKRTNKKSMGNCQANSPQISPEEAAVEQQLLDMQQQELMNPKILLLGAGESGKSTVVKQIKLIWKVGGGLTDRDKEDVTQAIRKNAIEAMQVLLEASRSLGVPLADASLQASSDQITALPGDATLTHDVAGKISALWGDAGIQTVFSRRDEYWNLDATPYYLTEVLRFCEDEYEPTDDDVVMARVRTTGIVLTQVRNLSTTS